MLLLRFNLIVVIFYVMYIHYGSICIESIANSRNGNIMKIHFFR